MLIYFVKYFTGFILISFSLGILISKSYGFLMGIISGIIVFLIPLIIQIIFFKLEYNNAISNRLRYLNYKHDFLSLFNNFVISLPYDYTFKMCISKIEKFGFLKITDINHLEGFIIAVSKMRYNSFGIMVILRLLKHDENKTEIEIAYRPILLHLYESDTIIAKKQVEKLVHLLKEN